MFRCESRVRGKKEGYAEDRSPHDPHIP